MKGLLQSKVFKKNLKKWLCMYVGVLVLLTSVVTYSKYVSDLNNNDEARVTKFNVKIENADNKICEALLDENTKLSYMKCVASNVIESDEELKIYFNVNTTEVEVLTNLFVTVNINENFELVSIKENDLNKYVDIITSTDSDGNTLKKVTIEDGSAVIYNLINGSTKGIKTYEVVVKYKNGFTNVPKDFEVVSVDYSAIQITKGGVINE